MRAELRTTINQTGISFSYRPFFRKDKQIRWPDIKNCYVRIYNPVKEYGGWGIRPAIKRGHGKAYNVSGNKGIQVELAGGTLILIGTGKPGEADEKIKKIQSMQ